MSVHCTPLLFVQERVNHNLLLPAMYLRAMVAIEDSLQS